MKFRFLCLLNSDKCCPWQKAFSFNMQLAVGIMKNETDKM